jgi:tetratricopeptide (TPR) repeat protein
MNLGRDAEALAAFDQALRAEPEFAAAFANRGILHDRMGQHEQALADYRRALALDPELGEGPGWITRFLRNQPQPPPTIADRADYLEAELAKPPGDRLLRVPERDAEQRPYKVEGSLD